jgi:hypothetical protein
MPAPVTRILFAEDRQDTREVLASLLDAYEIVPAAGRPAPL